MPLGIDAGSAFVKILPNTTGFGAALNAGLAKQGAGAGRALETSLSGAMQRAGRGIASAGSVLTKGITLPIVGAGLASIKLASDFQASFGRIQAISNASAANIAKWRGEVLQLAGATARSPKELADALFFLASAGLKSSQIMPALTASAKASAAGLGDITDIAKITGQALNAYAGSGLKAAQVTDTLVAAVKAGTAEPAEFAGALGRILPIAAKAGVTFDQVAASVAALSNIGLDANEAVTAMRGVLVALQAPGSQAAKTLKEIGISTDQMRASIREKGLLGAMQLLEKATGGNIDQMRKIIPNVRALTGQFGLVGENAKTVEGIFRQVSRATGDTDKAFRTISQTSEFKFKKALASLQATGITVGTKLLPVVTRVVEAVGGMADAFGRLSPKTQENIIKYGLLAAAAGPVLSIFGRLVGVAGKLIPLFTGIGRSAGAAGTGLAAAGTGASVLATAALRLPAAAALLAALGAGISTLADSRTDLVKTAEALGLTADQINAIRANIEKGGAERSVAGFFRHMRTGITGGFDKASLQAAQSMVQVMQELVAGGVPLARAQELVNRAFARASVEIDGTKRGLEEFKESLRTYSGATASATEQTKLNYFGLQRLGQQLIGSSAAAGIWNEVMTRARLTGTGIVQITRVQSDRIATLTQRLTNLGGNLTEGERKWLAVRIAAGDYNAALKILRDGIEAARKKTQAHGKSTEETAGKFRTARDAAQAYDQKIRNLPKEARTLFFASTTQAERDVLRYRAILYSLPSTINTRLYATPIIGRPRRAEKGGIIGAQEGAIVRAPTFVRPDIVAGEGHPATEAILPLESQRGISILSKALTKALDGAKGTPEPAVVNNFYVGTVLSKDFERLVEKAVDKAVAKRVRV